MNRRQRFLLPRTWPSSRRARSRQANVAATNSIAASPASRTFFRFASITQIYRVYPCNALESYVTPSNVRLPLRPRPLPLPPHPQEHDIICGAVGHERGQEMVDQHFR